MIAIIIPHTDVQIQTWSRGSHDGPHQMNTVTDGPHQMDTVTDGPHQMDTVTDGPHQMIQ